MVPEQVYKNDEEEFHLARAKLAQQSWRAVLKERQPPPLNLLMPAMGLLADVVGGIWRSALRVYALFTCVPLLKHFPCS